MNRDHDLTVSWAAAVLTHLPRAISLDIGRAPASGKPMRIQRSGPHYANARRRSQPSRPSRDLARAWSGVRDRLLKRRMLVTGDGRLCLLAEARAARQRDLAAVLPLPGAREGARRGGQRALSTERGRDRASTARSSAVASGAKHWSCRGRRAGLGLPAMQRSNSAKACAHVCGIAKVDAERREQILRRARRAAREEVEIGRRERSGSSRYRAASENATRCANA